METAIRDLEKRLKKLEIEKKAIQEEIKEIKDKKEKKSNLLKGWRCYTVVIQVMKNSTKNHILLELRRNVCGYSMSMHQIKELGGISLKLRRDNSS